MLRHRAATALLLSAASGLAQATLLRSADVHPDGYPTVEAVKSMGARISELTAGRHNARVFPGGILGSEQAVLEQVKLGSLHMARVNISALGPACPTTQAAALPFLFRDKNHMRRALDGPVGSEMLASCESSGLVGLAFYDSGARSIYTVSRAARTPADLAGQRIRVQPSDLWVALMGALGARATPLPYGEVMAALREGRLDGAENNWSSFESSGHYLAAKKIALTEHSMAPEILVFSKKAFDALASRDQAAVRQAAGESVATMRKLWDAREESSRLKVLASGVDAIGVDKGPFREAMRPVYDKFASDPRMQSLIARIQRIR